MTVESRPMLSGKDDASAETVFDPLPRELAWRAGSSDSAVS